MVQNVVYETRNFNSAVFVQKRYLQSLICIKNLHNGLGLFAPCISIENFLWDGIPISITIKLRFRQTIPKWKKVFLAKERLLLIYTFTLNMLWHYFNVGNNTIV